MSSWLWPDRVIGKRESRRLREEHNRLNNSHAKLLEAARYAVGPLQSKRFDTAAYDPHVTKLLEAIRTAEEIEHDGTR